MARLDDLEAEALEPVDGMERVRVRSEGLGQPVTLMLGADDRPVRATTTQVGPEGPAEVTVEYSDYREVDGLMLPFRMVQSLGGETAQTTTVETYDLAPTVAADAFDAVALALGVEPRLVELPFAPERGLGLPLIALAVLIVGTATYVSRRVIENIEKKRTAGGLAVAEGTGAAI